jgi:hypothetical protein
VSAIEVRGEVKTIACRQGSSGIFTGDIEGLYEGYRFGSTTPDEQPFTLAAPHGELAMVLRQQIVTRLPPRSSIHPFADGQDPFDDYDAGRPLRFLEAPPAPGGEVPWPAPSPTDGEVSGPEEAEQIFRRLHYMDVRLLVVPEKSTGVFSGATGKIRVHAPEYRMPGYVVVNTAHGDLKMDFLERGSLDVLRIDLTVDGAASTGMYAGASGELTAALTVRPPFFGRGPYEGRLNLVAARSGP